MPLPSGVGCDAFKFPSVQPIAWPADVNVLRSRDVQVLQELIGNEKKYVSVMEELLDTYLAPLETNDSLYVWLYHHYHYCHHYVFSAVGWAAGRASGL